MKIGLTEARIQVSTQTFSLSNSIEIRQIERKKKNIEFHRISKNYSGSFEMEIL